MVEFDPEKHTYAVDGVPKPSVTQIVSVLGDDIDVSEDIIERAAERGTTCHAVLAMAMRGEDYSGEYPDAYQPWVDSIEQFLAEHICTPLIIETPLGSPLLDYAGTPDAVCIMDRETVLLDYKFVSQIAKTKVKAQLNAYDALLNTAGVYVDGLYAVQFMQGGYRLYPVASGMEEFDAAMEIYRLRNKKHPKGRIE